MEIRNAKGQTEAEFLAAYNPDKYKKPSVTVDSVIITPSGSSLCLLLVNRKNHPFIYKWALPGGFINSDEDSESAARRELFEETGIKSDTVCQVRTFSRPDRDPRDRVVTIAYLGLAKENGIAPRAGDDAKKAELFKICVKQKEGIINISLNNGSETLSSTVKVKRLFDVEVEIISSDLAFDHAEIIAHALIKLAGTDSGCLSYALAPKDADGIINTINRIKMIFKR